jgi:DNA primase
LSRAEKVNILKSFLGHYHIEGGQQFLFKCPSCNHHKRKLSVNIEQNAFKCWICEYSGRNLAKIVQRHADAESKRLWGALTNQVNIEDLSEKIFGEEEKVKKKISLPEEYVSLCNKNLPKTATYALNYLTERGVTKADVIKWKIGCCTSGDFEGRLIIPSFDLDGDLNFFVGRSYDGNWMKYRNSIASKDIVFNELFVDFESDVVLVEGVFDAIKAGDNSIPLLGCSLRESSRLFTQIVKNNTDIYIALDADAERSAMAVINSLIKYDVLVKKINIEPYSDVGEMTKLEFLKRKKASREINSSNYLSSKILNL